MAAIENNTATKKTKIIYHYTCVWDRSGSICSMGSEPTKALRDFLVKLSEAGEEEEEIEVYVTVITHNQTSKICINNVKVSDLKLSEYPIREWLDPEGGTRCYDTIIEALELTDKNINTHKASVPRLTRSSEYEYIYKTVLYVLTDGKDNKSGVNNIKVVDKYSLTKEEKEARDAAIDARRIIMKEMIEKRRTENNMDTILIAANMNAEELAEKIGMSKESALTIDSGEHSQVGFSCATNLARSITKDADKYHDFGEIPPPPPSFSRMDRVSSAPRENSLGINMPSSLSRSTNG